MAFITRAKEDGVKTHRHDDCGIQRVEEVEKAREFGIDVIVTDHQRPTAAANSAGRRGRQSAPSRLEISLTIWRRRRRLKLCEALTVLPWRHKADSFGQFFSISPPSARLRLCAAARREPDYCQDGLERLQETKKPGLRALIAEAGFADRILKVGDVSHQMGPRLNSASRMDETQDALDTSHQR